MSYPIAVIPYANMAPYIALGAPSGCRFVREIPSRLARALQGGAIEAAPLPVGDLPALADVVEPCGDFGIAAAGAVKSVLLFSDLPFDDLVAPARVFLTDESSSSVRLLFLLLGHRNGFDRLPLRVRLREEADAELLIGDLALLQAREGRRRYVIDLAELWYRVRRLPFVFARWVVRRDAPQDCKSTLERWLAEFRDRDEELVGACARAESDRLGIKRQEMVDYLHGMRRVLGPDDLEGQRRFLEEFKRHQRNPLFAPAIGDGACVK